MSPDKPFAMARLPSLERTANDNYPKLILPFIKSRDIVSALKSSQRFTKIKKFKE